MTLNIAALALFELSLVFFAFAVAAKVAGRLSIEELNNWEFLTLWLSAKLAAGCLIPMTLTFCRLNFTWVYVVASCLLCMTAAAVCNKAWSELRTANTRFTSGTGRAGIGLATVIAGVLLGPAVAANAGPITEIDSVSRMGDVVQWAKNLGGPYDFPNFGVYQYPTFWEMAYLPSFVITGSDQYLWLKSLEAVALIAVAAASLAIRLNLLPGGLSAIYAVSVPIFWWGPSGVMTLKNDMIANAGLLVVVLALLHSRDRGYGAAQILLAGLGASFCCVKFSGPLVVGAIVIPFVVLTWPSHALRLRWKSLLTGIFVMALVTTGHYYVRNLVLFGNPLQPFGFSVFGVNLLDGMDLSQTSILSSIGDRRAWELLLSLPGQRSAEEALWPVGVLFPLALAAVLTLGCFEAAHNSWQAIVRRSLLSSRQLLIFPILAGWALYFISTWSAHDANAGEWFYLKNLMSLRYATGFLILSCFWLFGHLLRLPYGRAVVWTLLGADIASRVYILYAHFRPGYLRFGYSGADWKVEFALVIAGMLIACLLLVSARSSRQRRLLIGVYAAAIFLAAPALVERHRSSWLPQWRPVHEVLHSAPPARIHLISDSSYASSEYTVQRPGFTHDVTGAADTSFELSSIRTNLPEYLIWQSFKPIPERKRERFIEQLAIFGYTLTGENQYCVLAYAAKEAETIDAGAIITEAWYEEQLPGFPRVDSEFWSNLPPPALVASNAPHGLWTEDGGSLRRIRANPLAVRATNLGWPGADGRFSGLTIYSSAQSWHLTDSSWEQLVTRHCLTSLLTVTSGMNTTWSAGGSGRTSTEVLEEGEGYLKLTAHESMNWMAIFRKVEPFPERLALLAEVRYLGRPGYAVAYDIGQSGSTEVARLDASVTGKWLRLSLSEEFDPPWTEDYFAIGLEHLSSGDSIEIRTGAVVEGVVPRQKRLVNIESTEPGAGR